MDKTAAKAFTVLERLAASDKPCGVSDLARSLRFAKSNIHRHLNTLVELGYARRTGQGTYEPSLKLWEIGVQVLNRLDLKRIARPSLEWLAAKTDETVHLTVLDQNEIIYIDKIESTHPVREFTRVGTRAPAHCTATGKVLLAFQDAIPSGPLRGFTRHTIKNLRGLTDELARIRKRGYALNLGEYGAYVNGVAAPIGDHTGAVIAAVVISGPSERLKPERLHNLMPLVVTAGRKISVELGYRGAFPGWLEFASNDPRREPAARIQAPLQP